MPSLVQRLSAFIWPEPPVDPVLARAYAALKAAGRLPGGATAAPSSPPPPPPLVGRVGATPVPKATSSKPPIGLANESGSDCFLNAMRQFIYNTPALVTHLLEKIDNDESKKALIDDYNRYKERQDSTDSTPLGGAAALRKAVMPENLQSGQHDAHEALMHLFNQISLAKYPKGDRIAPENMISGTQNPLSSWVESRKTFDLGGLDHTQFDAESKESFRKTQNSSHVENTRCDISAFHTLLIKTNGKILGSLQEIWDNFANPKHPQTQDFGPLLVGSKERQPLKQIEERNRFTEAPEHLTLLLKRYTREEKITAEIDVTETFRLDHNHIKGDKAADYRFTLFIVQRGSKTEGHYVAYVRKGEQWFLCNDSTVQEVSKEEAKQAMRTAYIFYAERDSAIVTSKCAKPRLKSAPYQGPSPQVVGTITDNLLTPDHEPSSLLEKTISVLSVLTFPVRKLAEFSLSFFSVKKS